MGCCYHGFVSSSYLFITFIMKYKIVDNFIDDENFDDIVNSLTYDQEYFHIPSITGGTSGLIDTELEKTGYGFGFNFINMDEPGGKYQDKKNTPLVQRINNKILMKYGGEFGFKKLVRTRLDLTTHRGEQTKFHPHVDIPVKHFTTILYLHTCGSPTIVYNETQGYETHRGFGGGSVGSYGKTITSKQINNLTEMMRVDSVSNRLFIFEGNHLHTGMCAYDVPVRVLLNSNFL